MKTKQIILAITILVILISLLQVYMMYFHEVRSLSSVLKDSDFAQTNPPNRLVSPGTIAIVEDGKEGILKIVCPCENAFGDSISRYYIESPSNNVDLSEQLKGTLGIDLSFMSSTSLGSKVGVVKEITLKLTNVKILELPDDAIFRNLRNRSLFCSQAINYRLNLGSKVTLIKRVIQADAEYVVKLKNTFSQKDTVELMKDLALELTGGTTIKNENTIIGKDLYWGVDDDIALGNLKINQLPPTGSSKRDRLTKKAQSYKVELERVIQKIEPIKQPTSMSCWITVYTMMFSWKNRSNFKIIDVVNVLGEPWKSYYSKDLGLPADEVKNFLLTTGLKSEPPASYTLESYEKWLRESGPVWIISGDGINSHAKLLVSILDDNNGERSIFEFIDPATGAIQRMQMMEFIAEYEKEARFLNKVDANIPFRIQIIHF